MAVTWSLAMRRGRLIGGLIAAIAVTAAVYAQQHGAKALTALDYAEIQQLYARYAWSIDTHAENGMAYAKTFTPDGEFRAGDTKVAGRDQLVAFNLQMGVANRAPTHFNMNIMIEPAPEGAHGGSYLAITASEANAKPTLNGVGTYQDILVKTSEGWRFKQRNFYVNAMPSSPPATR
jgi:hypothetical protein